MSKAPQSTGTSRPPSPPSVPACVPPVPRRGAATGLFSTFFFLGCLCRLFNFSTVGFVRELNAALATVAGVADDHAIYALDVPLLKRVLRRADAGDEEIFRLVVFAAGDVEAAENRAILAANDAEAATHWRAADTARRNAGVPECFWQPRRSRP